MNVKSNNVGSNQLVSCIVPTLDEIDTIQNLISSVYQQDYRPIEMIIVDGGSKDGTLDIINGYIKSLTNELFSIQLHKEKDFGDLTSPANARNIGLDASSGHLIIFMDSDLYFLDNSTINTAVSEIGHQDYLLMYFDSLADTKLEKYISKTRKGDGIFLYKSGFIGNTRFIPTLGFGEDREFNYKLFKNDFSHELNLGSISVGRHYPHTKNELKKQNEWYGRTIIRYLQVIYSVDTDDFIKQFTYLTYNILMVIFPIILLIGILMSLKLTLAAFFLFITIILLRLSKCREIGVTMFLFLIWYSIYSGLFFTKGLISYVYKNKSIGRA